MGDHPKAPYRKQHKFATMIERIVAWHIGVDWEKYEKAITKVSEGKKQISGKDAFLLYQSYGFPIEMTLELAKEKKLKVVILLPY